MSLFEDDGCIRANIRTQIYRVTYFPKCDHVKIRRAQIILRAESATDALAFCAKWLALPQMTPTTAEEIPSALAAMIPAQDIAN